MLSLAILAGGESQRMGREKALLPFMGRPLVQCVLERLSNLADEIILVSNRPDSLGFLGLRTVRDILPGRGALGGLYTALANAAKNDCVAVVACDMPFANAQVFLTAYEAVKRYGCDGVVPHSSTGEEPLHAVYKRSTCLPAIRRALDQNLWRLNSWYGEVKIHFLPPEVILHYDPHQLAFLNINREVDLAQAEQLAKSGIDPFYALLT